MSSNGKQPAKPKVILRRCDAYEPDRIRGIIRECFEELGARPHGKLLVKPNVVTANRGYIKDSYTHLGVMEALLTELKSRPEIERITVGESSGFGIPPGLFLYESGYVEMAHRLGVVVKDFNEEPARWVRLQNSKLHKGMRVARCLLEAEYKIWAPKLKFHICCEITNAIKLNVGILQHRDRMKYHDDRLNEKIVDLLEVGYPNLIVSDAIRVGHGYESAPLTVQMGVIMVANHPLASDVVAATLLGYKPEEVHHLRIASERGYGSIHLNDIEITGDADLEEKAAIGRSVESEYQDIQKLDSPLSFYSGVDPDRGEFCYGGCLAAVKGCLGTIDKRRPGSIKNAPEGAIVTGVYHGNVIHPGQPVLLAGSCTKVTGKLVAGKVKRLKGCPIGTSQLLMGLPTFFKLPSPMTDLRSAVLFVYFTIRYLLKWIPTRMADKKLESTPLASCAPPLNREAARKPSNAKPVAPPLAVK